MGKFKQFLSKCFDLSNPGHKIKVYAKWAYIIEVIGTTIASFLAILVFISGDNEYLPLLILSPILVVLVLFISIIVFWLPTIMLYGFGDLIENSNRKDEDIEPENTSSAKASQAKANGSIKFKGVIDSIKSYRWIP